MTARIGWAFIAFDWMLLRAASLLVPARQRGEWQREWRAELWHVREARVARAAASWTHEREVIAFCLGAFADARCLRRERMRPATPAPMRGSPMQCILGFALVLVAGMVIGLLLPQVRAAGDAPLYRLNPGLILIQGMDADRGTSIRIALGQFVRWKARRQRYFDALAFYSVAREDVSPGSGVETRWTVAHATANLFALVGLPLRFAAADAGKGAEMPAVILSCEAFERDFGGNEQATGGVLRVGSRSARIAGVAPCGAMKLPGRVDAWLLEPDAGLSAKSTGFVLAHLTDAGRAEMTVGRAPITAYNNDAEEEFTGVSIEAQARGPWDLYLFAVFLAFLSLPAVTSVTMGEYSFSSHKARLSRQLSRLGFLAAKIALLLPIAWCVPLDMAYWHWFGSAALPEYIQLIAAYSICLFGMRWILLDQRRRCPVCLRRVTHPASVGDASRNFLAWNGTELICMSGHTLLHVPGLPTSWFSTQRWLYLDTSWDFLFAGSSDG